MSFQDSHCPCAGKKPADTMLCDECLAEFAGHPSMKVFNDGAEPLEARRHAAIILCSLAHKRKQKSKVIV